MIIEDIRVDKDEVHVHCDKNQRHDLFDGSIVKFTEVQGMVELNAEIEFQVESKFLSQTLRAFVHPIHHNLVPCTCNNVICSDPPGLS